jgi:hypothetical protein
MYNNDEAVTGSSLRSLLKVLYYQAFAVVYGIAGACSGGPGRLVMQAAVMCGSTEAAMN